MMARIKIKDLPKDMKISKNDMRKLTGGANYAESEITAVAGDNLTFDATNLQLQKVMADNRQNTLMSNIMKTKHDAEMNAINNIR